MGRKLALIIGNSQYQDPNLAKLVTPGEDANDLAAVLRSPDIGGFDSATTLINETDATIRLSIEDFFADKKPDDLLVLYFSGHGVRDEQGQLYLAAQNTRANRLRATAIPAEFITDEMDRSRSKRQVLILDCCHSGAFAQGSKAVAGESAGTGPAFEGSGYGRVVLTATDATQYAWEGDKVIGQADRSVFTHYLIEGLRTGTADTDQDGRITLDEMYDYTYEQVVAQTPKQTPGKWSYRQQGDIVIARNPHPPAKPAAPLSEILDTARRLSAVKAARLVVRQGINPGAIYPLRADTNTIGRNDGLEVTIRDTMISRRHARITRRDNEYFIEDLLSANSTFVNGKKLVGSQALKEGDQIAVGDTLLIFQLGGAAPAVTASDKAFVDKPQAAAVVESEAATAQPQNPTVAARPTRPLPPVAVPSPAKRISRWIWIGAAGGVLLLLATLFAVVSRSTPAVIPTATTPSPTVTGRGNTLEAFIPSANAITLLLTPTPSNTSVPTQTPSPTAAPPAQMPQPTDTSPPAAEPIVVYDDALARGWEDWSYEATIDLNNGNPVNRGTKSIAVTVTKGYGALSLRAPRPVSTAGYSAIRFWVYVPSGDRALSLYTESTDNGGESKLVSFTAPSGEWTAITVSLTELSNPSIIKRFAIQDESGAAQPTFFIDDLEIVP